MKAKLCGLYLPCHSMRKESAWCTQGASILLGCCKLFWSPKISPKRILKCGFGPFIQTLRDLKILLEESLENKTNIH